MNFLSVVAETTEAGGNLFGALGIDWRLLLIQIIAFLLLVLLLGRFVYPWLMKQVDERQKNIEEAAEAAQKAQAAAADSQEETAHLLAEARKEAAEIVSTAKLEASELQSKSEAKAKAAAEHIVADAQSRIEKEVEAAKKALHNETIELIALATAKVVGATHDKQADAALIEKTLKELA